MLVESLNRQVLSFYYEKRTTKKKSLFSLAGGNRDSLLRMKTGKRNSDDIQPVSKEKENDETSNLKAIKGSKEDLTDRSLVYGQNNESAMLNQDKPNINQSPTMSRKKALKHFMILSYKQDVLEQRIKQEIEKIYDMELLENTDLDEKEEKDLAARVTIELIKEHNLKYIVDINGLDAGLDKTEDFLRFFQQVGFEEEKEVVKREEPESKSILKKRQSSKLVKVLNKVPFLMMIEFLVIAMYLYVSFFDEFSETINEELMLINKVKDIFDSRDCLNTFKKIDNHIRINEWMFECYTKLSKLK